MNNLCLLWFSCFRVIFYPTTLISQKSSPLSHQSSILALPNYDSTDLDPEEHKNSFDAIMDVVAHLPSGEEFLIAASIWNPLALRYVTAAFSTAGFAAETGDKDKTCRYPTAQGKSVVPCVIESFGRLGPHFLLFIDRITHLAQTYHTDLAGSARKFKDDLLLDLSATINKIISKNYASSAAGAAHSHGSFLFVWLI